MKHILAPDIETQTLALIAIRVMDQNPNRSPSNTVAFKGALLEAYEYLQATKTFLKKMEEEAKAEAAVYWNSEEGKKRRAEAHARFEEFKKRRRR